MGHNWMSVTCLEKDRDKFDKFGIGENETTDGVILSFNGEYRSWDDEYLPKDVPFYVYDETDHRLGVCDGKTEMWHPCDGLGTPVLSVPFSYTGKKQTKRMKWEHAQLLTFLKIARRVRKMLKLNK